MSLATITSKAAAAKAVAAKNAALKAAAAKIKAEAKAAMAEEAAAKEAAAIAASESFLEAQAVENLPPKPHSPKPPKAAPAAREGLRAGSETLGSANDHAEPRTETLNDHAKQALSDVADHADHARKGKRGEERRRFSVSLEHLSVNDPIDHSSKVKNFEEKMTGYRKSLLSGLETKSQEESAESQKSNQDPGSGAKSQDSPCLIWLREQALLAQARDAQARAAGVQAAQSREAQAVKARAAELKEAGSQMDESKQLPRSPSLDGEASVGNESPAFASFLAGDLKEPANSGSLAFWSSMRETARLSEDSGGISEDAALAASKLASRPSENFPAEDLPPEGLQLEDASDSLAKLLETADSLDSFEPLAPKQLLDRFERPISSGSQDPSGSPDSSEPLGASQPLAHFESKASPLSPSELSEPLEPQPCLEPQAFSEPSAFSKLLQFAESLGIRPSLENSDGMFLRKSCKASEKGQGEALNAESSEAPGECPSGPESKPASGASSGESGSALEKTPSREPLEQPRGLELVTESKNWYLGQNERLLKITLALLAALIISASGNVIEAIARPEPRYFAVTRDLRVMEMPPLSEPVIANQSLLNWAADVLVKSLSLNFLTWRRTLTEIREDFDSKGYESFLEALESGGHLKKIEEERLSLSCVVSGAPVVVASGVRAKIMTWRLEMPLTLSYESSSGVVATQRLMAEVEVQRAKPTQNPRGVVIRQMVLSKSG